MLVPALSILVGLAVLLGIAILAGSLLRRISSAKPQPPAWAQCFFNADHDRFLKHLGDAIQTKNLTARIGNGILSVITGGSAQQIPLDVLARTCCGIARQDWTTTLADELGKITSDSPTLDLADFDRIKDSLRFQLGIPDGLPTTATVGREDLPGVATILVLDLPTAVRTINPVEAIAWNHPPAELMQIALDHIRGMPAPAIEQIELNDRAIAFALTGESPFTASHALLLDEYPKLLGPFGAIVAVPTSHILLSYPINSSAIQDALFPLAWIATRRWNDGPASITPRLYWYRDGRFIHLPYDFNREKFSLHPPAEFAAMLESLRVGYRFVG